MNVYQSYFHTHKETVSHYIAKYITELELLQEKGTMNQWISWLQTRHIVHLFSLDIAFYELGGTCNGEKNSTLKRWVCNWMPSGLTFMNKDFYEKKTKRNMQIKKKYIGFLEKLFHEGLGIDHGYNWRDIYELEKKMAAYLYNAQKVYPFEKKYNEYSAASFQRLFDLDLCDFFGSSRERFKELAKAKALALAKANVPCIVENPTYLKHAVDYYKKAWNTGPMKTYIVYHILLMCSSFSPALSQIVHDFKYPPFVKMETRDNNAIHFTKLLMNNTLSRAYIAHYENKKEAALCKTIVHNILDCCLQRFRDNPIFSSSTREKIIQKIKALGIMVGHMSHYEEDPDLDFSPTDALANTETYLAWKQARDLEKLGLKKGRQHWMALQLHASNENVYDVNAYYMSHLNMLYIPNAILQPPFIDATKTAAYNYANMGTVIGHELMHAFDSDGFYYDEGGYRCKRPFWKREEIATYEERQKKIMAIYQVYAARDHLQVNPMQTIAENIADIGGFLLAEMALQVELKKSGLNETKMHAEMKQFYRYYGEKWRSIMKPSVVRDVVETDVHALSKYRVNCVLGFSSLFQRLVVGGAESHEDVYPF
jgi:predicted metalloendopeptidase